MKMLVPLQKKHMLQQPSSTTSMLAKQMLGLLLHSMRLAPVHFPINVPTILVVGIRKAVGCAEHSMKK